MVKATKAIPKAVARKKKSVQTLNSRGLLKPTAEGRSRARKGLWVPSDNKPPTSNKLTREAVQLALKKGTVVLEINGTFLNVPLSQKLSLKNPCPSPHSRFATDLKRYEGYMQAKTVGEAFKFGALAGDFAYDLKHGSLRFVPALKGTPVKHPLPISQWPEGIRASGRHAPWWLPDNWAHGVKTTCKSYLPVFIAPDRRTCYHQVVVEAIVRKQLSNGLERMIDWAKKQLSEMKDWTGEPIKFDPDGKLFACLSRRERSCLPSASEFHFGVISARRASGLSGIRGIVNVQSRLLAAGIRPRWYVDGPSLGDYKQLGLDAVIGGKLTPSRNRALRDASKLKKACVQISDDVSGWEFLNSDLDATALRRIGNAEMIRQANAAKTSSQIAVSPLAAARFLLAKMRAAEGQPHLGGVLPTGNSTLAMLAQMTTTDGFILGDFFVHDDSPCRFDETLTLKEDYDFTCCHLQRHGCVLRCNRLVLKVAHETNPGGAVAVRDSKGENERRNIKILMRKWPGVFKLHSTRGDTEVKMRWSHLK